MEQYDFKSRISYFIEDNADRVATIIRYAYGISSADCHSIQYDQYSDGYFSVYDINGEKFISFLAKSYENDTKICLFIDDELGVFNNYKSTLRHEFLIIFDLQFQEVFAEILCGTASRITNLLKINLFDTKISIEYVFKDVSFEKHYLKSRSISSALMEKELSIILDAYINHRNLFKAYSISEIVNAHDNPATLKDIIQIADMAMI